jgi:molecular chaperone GrpE
VTDEPTTGKAGSPEPTGQAESTEPTTGDAGSPEPTDQAEPIEPTTGEAGPTDADSTEPTTGEAASSSPAGEEDRAPTARDAFGEGTAADAAVEADADLQAAADAVEVDLELLLSERAQYLDAYRRAQADFENYRKQAQRRQDDAVVRSLGRFVEGLLPVLDSCDAALAHGASEVEPVLTALYGALSKEGLERIDPKGAAFDPTEAEAVVHEPGEGGEQVVAEVLRPGYRWRGQVLRPAMVKVSD